MNQGGRARATARTGYRAGIVRRAPDFILLRILANPAHFDSRFSEAGLSR
jgi:hypothetical protein